MLLATRCDQPSSKNQIKVTWSYVFFPRETNYLIAIVFAMHHEGDSWTEHPTVSSSLLIDWKVLISTTKLSVVLLDCVVLNNTLYRLFYEYIVVEATYSLKSFLFCTNHLVLKGLRLILVLVNLYLINMWSNRFLIKNTSYSIDREE